MKKLSTTIVIIIVVIAAGWFLKDRWMSVPNTTSTADIEQDLQNISINNVDEQFQSIDNDLSGL